MKQTRKGMGIGMGIGYKNLVPLDPYIHSLSAKGIGSKVFPLVRVSYGKKSTPKKDREYKMQLYSGSPVGTIKEWKKFGKKSGVDKLHINESDGSHFYVDIDAKGRKKCVKCGKYEPMTGDNFCEFCDEERQNIDARGRPKDRHLIDEFGNKFSANAGDYWDMKPEAEFKNMVLVEDGEIIKKNPKKKDLKDYIYEQQAWQKSHLMDRKSVAPKKLFRLSTKDGKDYIIDSKGRMTQSYNFYKEGRKGFSGQWLFNGLFDRWGRKVASWEDVLKNPKKYKDYKGGLYVADLDNGTNRIWGVKFSDLYETKPRTVM